VSLAYPAAIGGVGVSLTADNGVNVPGAVIVPEGLTATTFLVAVSSAAGQTFHVSASLNGSGRTATFDQGPACVNGLALSSDGIMSGMGLKGSIILSDPAPSAGVAVSLITANSLVTVTPTATVPAGQMSAPFDIKTAPTVNPSKATITAAGSCGGTSTDLNLVVVQCVSSVSLSAAAVTGGGNLTGTVKLNAPALAGGLLVTFSSSDPSVQVDNSVRVEEGQTTATFHANTRSVGSKTIVSVVATVGNCGSALATLTLMP
jgi:hypothetical protein